MDSAKDAHSDDDDDSLPDLQLSAVTEALLAGLDGDEVEATDVQDVVSDVNHSRWNDALPVRGPIQVTRQLREASTPTSSLSRHQTNSSDDRYSSLRAQPRRFPARAAYESLTEPETRRPRYTTTVTVASAPPTTVQRDLPGGDAYRGSPRQTHARRSAATEGVERIDSGRQATPESLRRVSLKSRPARTSPDRGPRSISEDHPNHVGDDLRDQPPDLEQLFISAPPLPAPQTTKSPDELAAAAPPVFVPSSLMPAVDMPEKRRTMRRFIVKEHSYSITRKLGKGGSGRVYEVVSDAKQLWAFKVIPLQGLDERAKQQIRNEVSLLQNLRSVSRVIYLHDWVVDEAKKSLYIVMELGACDLDHILRDKMDRQPELDMSFVGYYWVEMLRCVAAIHDVDVVHSDLKPANFILAGGILKIADFGIANALPDDTVHVYSEHQSGTPNYMAPETLKAMSQTSSHSLDTRAYRFGKPSDIWSLACIFHLMVYGRQPFGHIQGLGPKLMAIIDPDHEIVFWEEGLGGVSVPPCYLRTMRACLSRDPAQRPTADGLLQKRDGLLPPEASANTVHVTARTLETILGEALDDAGARASPEEIRSWTSKIMRNLERST